MLRRNLTPSEVQEIIPSLELVFGRLVMIQAERDGLQRQLGPAPQEEAAVMTLRIEALTQEQQALERHVGELGGILKDRERGLVDFPCQRGSETVLLCWQFGEKRLGFWHGDDEGFANRKPLDAAPAREVELLN